MKIERSLEPITNNDLKELLEGSVERLRKYFVQGDGVKWREFYNMEQPLAVALCQGGAMHYFDKQNGVKDFDIWFFYPLNKKHLPCKTIWTWDYTNPKFGCHPSIPGYTGRRVDTIVRSIRNYTLNDPVKTIHQYLQNENTKSSKELAKKAVVILAPDLLLGKVVWYKGKI